MDKPPAIEISDVRFAYDGTLVLEDVSVTIPQGDFVSIVGPNGGGKTTLLRLILGLIQPSAGTVRVFGVPPEKARHRVGYMPQHSALDLQFPATVMDVALMGRLGSSRFFGPYSRKDKEIVAHALEKVGLSAMRAKSFASLSGGQRQRLLIARALACEPDLLLLDEPTSNLDVVVESEFYALLKELNARSTVVLVSHDLGFVSQFVRNVVCVKRRVAVHPTTEVTGEIISSIYGSRVRMVRHDQNESKEIAGCFNS
jgi:zinc transport system ATP-binding protein